MSDSPEMAAWKARHGVSLGSKEPVNQDELLMAAEEEEMKTETETELRELDAWILEHIFGGALALTGEVNPLPHYATDPAAAFEVLKKCMGKTRVTLSTDCLEGNAVYHSDASIIGTGETLELAICRFAKALFSTK